MSPRSTLLTMRQLYRARTELRETMELQGRTVNWLTRVTECSRQHTSEMLHQRTMVSQPICERVGAALGVSWHTLFDLSQRRKDLTDE